MIKVHILFKFTSGAFGGGNQFLKALRDYFREKDVYVENPEDADVILFNSNRSSLRTLRKKLYYLKFKKNKILTNRVDGPFSKREKKNYIRDVFVIKINDIFMDGIIYQSNWSFEGMNNIKQLRKPVTVIHNAPDNEIFYPPQKKKTDGERIRLIANSWSISHNVKGFDTYKFLDNNLDFSKYEMTFVGRSPIEFKNINYLEPVESKKMADILRQHDIFIAASVNDACSNSLIEALQSGLPAVVANSGGHPELVKNGGLVFNSEDDILEAIDKLASNFDHFKKNLPRYLIQEAGEQYLRFLESIFKSKKQFPEKKTDIFLKIMRYISFELFFVKNWLNKIRSTRKWP